MGDNNRELALEHTLQSRQRPELVRSDNQFSMHPTTPIKGYRPYTSVDNFLQANGKRPRTGTNDSQMSYGTSTSGRNTPDTPRAAGYKVNYIELFIVKVYFTCDSSVYFHLHAICKHSKIMLEFSIGSFCSTNVQLTFSHVIIELFNASFNFL